MRRIHVRIERLILDGPPLTPAARAAVGAAVEAELAGLLATGGLAPDLGAGGAIPSVRGSALVSSAEGNPAAFGRDIARAVYGGIGP